MLYYKLLAALPNGFSEYADSSPHLSNRIANALTEFTENKRGHLYPHQPSSSAHFTRFETVRRICRRAKRLYPLPAPPRTAQGIRRIIIGNKKAHAASAHYKAVCVCSF